MPVVTFMGGPWDGKIQLFEKRPSKHYLIRPEKRRIAAVCKDKSSAGRKVEALHRYELTRRKNGRLIYAYIGFGK